MVRRTVQKGFTLVEILIVVIILGILAAIVIPQFTNASQDARRSNMISQLQTLKSQIALYKLQHNDNPPPVAAAGTSFWDDYMCRMTNSDHTAAAAAGAGVYGPYFPEALKNPLVPNATATNVVLLPAGSTPATAIAGGAGWGYTPSTGEVYANAGDGTVADADGR
jgi:general secretion pathway protein G